ncbi:MAG: hypothetical protein NC433_07450 [Clostridiales bacterium]|nr:hypothetical protein [Clostridiales bacterium]
MKKYVIIAALLISLLLGGCGDTQNTENKAGGILEVKEYNNQEENAAANEISVNNATINETGASNISEIPEKDLENDTVTTVVQNGPYGQLSLSLPADWTVEACPLDSDSLLSYGMYGIRFYPQDVNEGCIELFYTDSFGVCGTGLYGEKTVIAGKEAHVGTYDGLEYWDFISFAVDEGNVVAMTHSVEDWWSEYDAQVLEILDTMSFDETIKEGGAYVYSRDSEAEKIALMFSLKNISSTGATLVFNQYDKEAPDGTLQFGDDYVLEQLKDGEWEEVPVVVEGNYAFYQVAYIIAPDSITEAELDWEWLYGELAPGNYRIKKTVDDFRESGDFDIYTIYAEFIFT